jgi:hypothetical protein
MQHTRLTVFTESNKNEAEIGVEMGRFTVFVAGCADGLPIEMAASSVQEVERLVGSSRFVAGELMDVPDQDGVCTNRAALIPLSRIQMIVESD